MYLKLWNRMHAFVLWQEGQMTAKPVCTETHNMYMRVRTTGSTGDLTGISLIA
jgi:hypothetical protein